MSRQQTDEPFEIGKIGCVGFGVALLVAVAAVILVLVTSLTFRSQGVQIALIAAAACLVVGIVFTILGNRQNERLYFERKAAYAEQLRRELKAGMRFEAVGSMAQDLEGRFVRWIDRDTIEAEVRDPRGGRWEKGPFPVSRIKNHDRPSA